MKGTTHITGGLVFAFLFNVPAYAVPFAVIGSTFPDIDLKFSTLIPPKGKKKSLWSTHRGITHHPAVVLALFLLWVYLENTYPQYHFYWQFLYGFWVGYLSHLVLDSMTKLGIPVGFGYYPRFSLNLMKTGGVGEKVFFVLLVIAFVGILYLKSQGIL
jgi:inner membrane protein